MPQNEVDYGNLIRAAVKEARSEQGPTVWEKASVGATLLSVVLVIAGGVWVGGTQSAVIQANTTAIEKLERRLEAGTYVRRAEHDVQIRELLRRVDALERTEK